MHKVSLLSRLSFLPSPSVVIFSLCKRRLLVCSNQAYAHFYSDEGVSFAVQKGVQISRSNIRWFKHNDMNDLERVLDDIRVEDMVHKRKLTRRFIVTEGLFANEGDIAPLAKLVISLRCKSTLESHSYIWKNIRLS